MKTNEVWFQTGRDLLVESRVYPLTRGAIYPSRLIWCEMMSFGGRNVFFLSNIMGLVGTSLSVLKLTKNMHLKNSTTMSLSKNNDPLAQDNPQTLL